MRETPPSTLDSRFAISDRPVWDDLPHVDTPPLRGEVAADVCVIGLGGTGLTAVVELLGQGQRVVAIDAGAIGAGAAGRNGGFLLAGGAEFHHDAVARWGRERAVRIYHETLAELDRFLADPDTRARRTGSLRIATGEEELADCRAQLAAMEADGLPAAWYRGPEGEGLRIPTDAVFHPMARLQALARRALAAGASLHQHAPAVEIAHTLVRTPEATIRAPLIVVAVDGGLDLVLPELAGRVRTARLQMLATAPTAEVHFPMPVYARYGFEYWQQLPDGRVALGGLRDRFGDGEWTAEAVPTAALQQELERVLRQRLGVREAPVVARWAGAVGYTPDYLPILEMVRPGVLAIGGYCGTGNLVGAICARAATAWARTGHPLATAFVA